MAHWTIKKEHDIEDDESNNIILITDDDQEFETMFDAPDKYVAALNQGIELSNEEAHTVSFLHKHYPIETAIDAVTAFRFKESVDVVDAKFMLAPGIDEVKERLQLIDSPDIKELLAGAGISGRKYAKEIMEPERTIRNRLNEHNNKTELSFSQKFVAMVLLCSKYSP